MKYLSLVILSVFFLSACQHSNEEVSINENVVADSETKLALDGMVCAMGCVSAIQNQLKSTPGVAFATVNYEEGFAIIKYDSKLVNEDGLIAAIGSIGDHSYSAKKYSESTSKEDEETIDVVEAVETVMQH